MSGIVHPCKVYGILSIGRPVLSLGPKESYLNNIIETKSIGLKTELTGAEITRIGWSVMHGDVKATIKTLKAAISQTQKEREAICLRAQEKAFDEFGRNNQILQFLDTIVC